MTKHYHGPRTCDGKGGVQIVGTDGKYTWDVCDECAEERRARIAEIKISLASACRLVGGDSGPGDHHVAQIVRRLIEIRGY